MYANYFFLAFKIIARQSEDKFEILNINSSLTSCLCFLFVLTFKVIIQTYEKAIPYLFAKPKLALCTM